MSIPTLDEVIAQMEAVSGASSIDPDQAVHKMSDVDSLDMMEWLYEFQEDYPHIGASEVIFEDMTDDTTFRSIYEALVSPFKAGAEA